VVVGAGPAVVEVAATVVVVAGRVVVVSGTVVGVVMVVAALELPLPQPATNSVVTNRDMAAVFRRFSMEQPFRSKLLF